MSLAKAIERPQTNTEEKLTYPKIGLNVFLSIIGKKNIHVVPASGYDVEITEQHRIFKVKESSYEGRKKAFFKHYTNSLEYPKACVYRYSEEHYICNVHEVIEGQYVCLEGDVYFAGGFFLFEGGMYTVRDDQYLGEYLIYRKWED